MKKNSLYYISWSSSEGCLVCKMFLRNLKLAQFAVKFKRRAAKLKPKQASSVCDCVRVRYLYLCRSHRRFYSRSIICLLHVNYPICSLLTWGLQFAILVNSRKTNMNPH